MAKSDAASRRNRSELAERLSRTELAQRLSHEVRQFIANTILFNQTVAEGIGLNATDLQCLNLLDLHGSLKPSELARMCGLTTGGMTVVLDRLENAGYVRRDANPDDRRSLIIRPVAAKARKLTAKYQSKSETLARVLAAYDDAQLELILDFFTRTNGANRPPV